MNKRVDVVQSALAAAIERAALNVLEDVNVTTPSLRLAEKLVRTKEKLVKADVQGKIDAAEAMRPLKAKIRDEREKILANNHRKVVMAWNKAKKSGELPEVVDPQKDVLDVRARWAAEYGANLSE